MRVAIGVTLPSLWTVVGVAAAVFVAIGVTVPSEVTAVAVAVAVFVSMFYFAGGTLSLDKQSVLLVFSATMLFALLYRALWCLGGGDTPGTRSAGMRVVNFDGRSPDRSQRGRRLAAGMLSVLSVGLGLIWILVDEENLSWHDHISKTFPTPV